MAFTATWSAETHPEGFPAKPHFSALIGATHRITWAMWRVGGLASAGIEQMAERGKARPLADEIETAIRADHAVSRLSGDGIKRSPSSVSLDFQVTRGFPLVSLVSMLAPSPDWPTGRGAWRWSAAVLMPLALVSVAPAQEKLGTVNFPVSSNPARDAYRARRHRTAGGRPRQAVCREVTALARPARGRNV